MKDKIDVEKILSEFEALENARLNFLEKFMIENKENLEYETDIADKEVNVVPIHTECTRAGGEFSFFTDYYFIPETKEYADHRPGHDYWSKAQRSEILKFDLTEILKGLVERYQQQEKQKGRKK